MPARAPANCDYYKISIPFRSLLTYFQCEEMGNKFCPNHQGVHADPERKLAIEKIDSQYANQLKLEKFKLDNQGDELLKAAKAEIFADEIKNYPGRTDAAQRAAEFKTVT